ncbi:MAG: nucleotidyltransferase domain-containing protein [bacterium]|nr:MAG: nucleotidyltransferase domain-containing protein [bacterium]
MISQKNPLENVIDTLKERAKELNCLYSIEEALNDRNLEIEQAFQKVVNAIPPGWQYPDVCEAIVDYRGQRFKTSEFKRTSWMLQSQIKVQEEIVGKIEVFYTEERTPADEGPFLKEERKLIDYIADRLGHYLLHRNIREIFTNIQTVKESISDKEKGEWRIIVDLLRRTDQNLYIRVSRKMMNYLSWHGVDEAQNLMQQSTSSRTGIDSGDEDEVNRPQRKTTMRNIMQISDDIFDIAGKHLTAQEIFSFVQKWIHEDKSSFLIRTLENQHSSLSEISEALTRYQHLAPDGIELSDSTQKAMNVLLIRRFFTDQLEFINIAKNYVTVTDFHDLLRHLVYPMNSQGKLGGKSAGLFLAYKILCRMGERLDLCSDVGLPKTWYISSDGLLNFLHFNNLEEVIEQKYKEIDQVRQEYPHIIQLFKNSQMPSEIIQGLSVVLDDIGDKPIIVRSSSLLEDRLGSAFSGKYKSLFLANRGDKETRMEALLDAIAEVYASTFGPDPIEYRASRGLLDFHEEMGIMIQEVVGKKVGNYFLPAFAGVAFSTNEFRWSPRIKRNDGLIRMVPGLGTRAVDRLSDDYPVLIAPGQPGLRVNITPEDVIRYSPKKIDVIDLEQNTFVTMEYADLVKEVGDSYPALNKIISIAKDHHIQQVLGFVEDFQREDVVVTFDGIVNDGKFLQQVKTILDVLRQKLDTPVDIEFAHDGKKFYLLQCRPQSFSQDSVPVPIPREIPEERIIFSANRYISNGKVPDITHIVYIDPAKYTEVEDLEELRLIGRAVGKLNKVLPKRRFILMGPGRWGSRGDIKLGVSVTYADISNTAVLIEVARKKGNYVPDLSFGTHFFQDLVESSIRYLPLYPDDDGIVFNESFLNRSPNILEELLPEFSQLNEVIKVIDVQKATAGSVLRILLNADLDEGMGVLSAPSETLDIYSAEEYQMVTSSDENWRWRLSMAKKIAAELDAKRFGVKAFYLFGSTKNAIAGPGSDIDVIIHFSGSAKQKKELDLWFEGWSLCLSELNYLRTGYRAENLLDVHYVDDEEVKKKSGFAVKIGAVTDAARPLPLKNQKE